MTKKYYRKEVIEDINEVLAFMQANNISDFEAGLEYWQMNCLRRKAEEIHKYTIGYNANQNHWYTRIDCEAAKDKRKKITRKTKEELLDFLVDYYDINGAYITVNDCFEIWMDKAKEDADIKKSSMSRYRQVQERHFFENEEKDVKRHIFLGKMYISSVTDEDILDFVKQEIKVCGLNQKSLATLKTNINLIFKFAKREFGIDIHIYEVMRNIADEIGNKNILQPAPKDLKEDEEQIFSDEERDLIKRHLLDRSQLVDLALIVNLKTGARIAEIAALKKSDVDLPGKRILIRRTESRYIDEAGHYQYEIESTKTRAGNRQVFVDDECLEILKQILIMRESDPLDKTEWLFSKKGVRFNANKLERRLYTVEKSLGMAVKGTHTSRRTVATKLVNESGMPLVAVAKHLGHSDISTTQKCYVKDNVSAEQKLAALNKLKL